MTSGLAAGAEVKGETYRASELYDRFRLTGADATLFQNVIDDADGDPTTGYDGTLVAVRPLPEGVYRLQEHKQIHSFIPCDFFPDDAYDEWKVTVMSPPSAVHEAFFDPVAIGAAVGADGTNGVLKPAAFTVGGASATITSLKWESGVVTMELNPSASLAGHAVDFIALDGSVALTLSFDDATQGGRRADVARGGPALARRRPAHAAHRTCRHGSLIVVISLDGNLAQPPPSTGQGWGCTVEGDS